MKIGIDLHGVAFSCPEFFSTIGELLINAGHEVHIITGAIYSDELEAKMKKNGLIKGKSYSHFFSIVQHHIDLGHKVKYDERGNPWMDEDLWNKTKSEYCHENEILLHFDDQSEHLDSFKTPSCLFSMENIK